MDLGVTFSGLGSIVLLFGVLFSRQIREDLVRAATSPFPSLKFPLEMVYRGGGGDIDWQEIFSKANMTIMLKR